MKYVCPKCGAPVSETDNVCPKCGMKFDWGLVQNGANQPDPNAQQQPETNQPDQQQTNPNQFSKAESKVRGLLSKKQSKNKMFSVIVLGLFLLVFLGPANDSPQHVKPVPAASSSSSAAPAAKTEHPQKEAQKAMDKKLDATEKAMVTLGGYLNGAHPLATSYGHSDKGFMALYKGTIFIVDLQNNRIAFIDNPQVLYNYRALVKDHKKDRVIVWFIAPFDDHDQDKDAGYWRKNESHELHVFPIYMLWKFDGDKVVDDGLYTATGEKPSHYQDFLHEQKNVDLAHLFMSETIPFLQDVEERGVYRQIEKL